MITDVLVAYLSQPVQVNPGDRLIVTHKVEYQDRTVETHLVQQEITVPGTWTCSILFKLNGEPNHLIGNEKTIEWIKGLEVK